MESGHIMQVLQVNGCKIITPGKTYDLQNESDEQFGEGGAGKTGTPRYAYCERTSESLCGNSVLRQMRSKDEAECSRKEPSVEAAAEQGHCVQNTGG